MPLGRGSRAARAGGAAACATARCLSPPGGGGSRPKRCRHQPKPLPGVRPKGAQPAVEQAAGGQRFGSRMGSCKRGVREGMTALSCSCPPAFRTPRRCWIRQSPAFANYRGAEGLAGLAPSPTLFRIFRNINCHGYQSAGSSLATFALDVRLTKLFLHGAGRCCGCSSACRQHGPSLHLQPAAWLRDGKPAAGTWHHRGETATGPGVQAAFQSPFCCISPRPQLYPPVSRRCLAPLYQAARTYPLSFSLMHVTGSSAFESIKCIRCSYHHSAMTTQHQCCGQRAFLTLSLLLSKEELFKASY